MKRYMAIIAGMMGVLLAIFLLAEALGIPILHDPTVWLQQGGLLAAVLGVGLLIADVLLPFPSSLIMMALGALFGVALGTLLSLIGCVGAALLGFAIGRRGGPLLGRFVSAEASGRADQILRRWGILAVIVTRPVPILAETVVIIAGTSSMSWGTLTLAALAGSLPGALLYALAGALSTSFSAGVVIFGLVLAIASGFWLVGARLGAQAA